MRARWSWRGWEVASSVGLLGCERAEQSAVGASRAPGEKASLVAAERLGATCATGDARHMSTRASSAGAARRRHTISLTPSSCERVGALVRRGKDPLRRAPYLEGQGEGPRGARVTTRRQESRCDQASSKKRRLHTGLRGQLQRPDALRVVIKTAEGGWQRSIGSAHLRGRARQAAQARARERSRVGDLVTGVLALQLGCLALG